MRVIDEDIISVGDSLPRIHSVQKGNGPYSLVLTWETGSRVGTTDVIDVAPQIFTYKVYKELRDNTGLFAQVSVSDDKTAVVWPGNADFEISADALEELAEQSMTSAGFQDFIKSMGWTLDAAAAQLGISRRLVAYYAKEREIPRTIALACRALQHSNSISQAVVSNTQHYQAQVYLKPVVNLSGNSAAMAAAESQQQFNNEINPLQKRVG